MGKEIITITGALGSGKTVVGKAVAQQLAAPYYSTGDMQRALAAQKGMTTLELNQLAEKEPSIDHEIDGMTEKLAAENERCVFDSRLAWHFVPYSFKCYLQVHDKIAAQRIFGDTRRKSEKYASVEEAYQGLVDRKASETRRFADLYGVDLGNLENYDLVVDTSVATPEAVAEIVADCFHKWLAGKDFPKLWASPKALFPTRAPAEGEPGPIRVTDRDGYHLTVAGHAALSEAIRQGKELVSYEPAPGGAETSEAFISEWENAHGFKFFARPFEG